MSETRAHATAETRSGGVLVLGLGNVLLADDGIGAAAVARVERDYLIPRGVRLLEGGTLGLSLLDEIAQTEHLILVDAVATDARPAPWCGSMEPR